MNYPMLPEKNNLYLAELHEEIQDTIQKVQKFRTETEMRVSVLNNGDHPTKASKYWQCVREQNMMYEQLKINSYEYRRREAKILGMKYKLKKSKDKYEKMELQVDIEEMEWSLENIKITANDRVRELKLWSKIKKELDDGSFNTIDVNIHQAETLELQLQNRLNALTQGSSQAEVLNVVGPLETVMNMLGKPNELYKLINTGENLNGKSQKSITESK
jgi:hypothetical protein